MLFTDSWLRDKARLTCFCFRLALVVFSGGLSRSMNVRPTVTVMKGRSLSVLEVAHPIVDFVGMISTPWTCGKCFVNYFDKKNIFCLISIKDKLVIDFEEPNALAVLTDRDLVVVDLESPGYPSIDPGHVLDIHDSPVTCLKHVSDPNTDLIPGLYKISKPHHEENCKKVKNYLMFCFQVISLFKSLF